MHVADGRNCGMARKPDRWAPSSAASTSPTVGIYKLAANNVGDPAISGSHTLTVVAIVEGAAPVEIPVAGRTRWAIFDPEAQLFYVNIAKRAPLAQKSPGN